MKKQKKHVEDQKKKKKSNTCVIGVSDVRRKSRAKEIFKKITSRIFQI